MKNCCTGYWNIKIKAGEMNEKNVKFEKTGVKPGYTKNSIPTNRIIQGVWEIDQSIDSPQVHRKRGLRGAVLIKYERAGFRLGALLPGWIKKQYMKNC